MSRQRRRIGEALLTESDETVLSLLRSLVRLGDCEAIPYVERLAAGEGRAAGSEVVQAASDALPELREAARLHEAEQTLLRPAMPAESEMLLRPAVAGPKSSAGTLVRPVEGEEQVSHGEGTGSTLRTRT